MLKKSISLLIVSLFISLSFISPAVAAHKKTKKIGKFIWYTEQNNFNKIVAIAKKENKMILADFSATWCMPCQMVKKSVFMKDGFKSIHDRVITLYIEQTTKKGQQYNKKFNIKYFPTFKLFSKDGNLLETGNPERTLAGFNKWIDEVEKGNNLFQLKKQLKLHPNDRQLMFRIVKKIDEPNFSEKVQFLKKIIENQKDFTDSLTQQAIETLLYIEIQVISFQRDEKSKQKVIEDVRPYVKIAYENYYPKKFNYRLKAEKCFSFFLKWYNFTKNNKQFEQTMLDFFSEPINIQKDYSVFNLIQTHYLNLKKPEKAAKTISFLSLYIEFYPKYLNDAKRLFFYQNMLFDQASYFNKNKKEAEKKYNEYFSFYRKLKNENGKASKQIIPIIERNIIKTATTKGFLIKEATAIFDEQIPNEKGAAKASTLCSKAKLLDGLGKKEQASKILIDFAQSEEVNNIKNKKDLSNILNELVWTLYELKTVNKDVLKIAKKSVKLYSNDMNLDTLACVYAALGKYKKAIRLEKKALKKSTNKFQSKNYINNIEKWKNENKK